jgi:hypothetical protein
VYIVQAVALKLRTYRNIVCEFEARIKTVLEHGAAAKFVDLYGGKTRVENLVILI